MTAARARTQRALTTPEMLVSLAIFAVMMGVLFVLLALSNTSHLSMEAYLQVQQEARRAFDAMGTELRGARNVSSDIANPPGASIAAPGVQRLDFQIIRDLTACGGPCWGTDDPGFPTGWIHYVLDTTEPANARLVRCLTATQADPMPAGFAGCRTLATRVSSTLANTSFTYDHPTRTVTIRLQTAVTSTQLPGGVMGTTPVPLISRVNLRNP